MGLVPPGTRLAERDPAVPAWNDVPVEQQRLFARHMESYAAMLDCADQNIGRLVALLDDLGELGNTIFVFSSDNGGTNSAGPAGALHFNRRYAGLPALPIDSTRARSLGRHRAGLGCLSDGLGAGLQYPIPVLQDLYRRRRAARQLCRLMARQAQGFRSDPQPVRPCHRCDAHPARSRRSAGSETSHGKPAKAMQGKSLAPVLRDGTRRRRATSNITNAGPIVRITATVGSPSRCRSVARRSTSTIGHCTPIPRISPRAWICDASTRKSSPSLSRPLTKPPGRIGLSAHSRTPAGRVPGVAADQRPPASSRRRFLPNGQTVHRDVIAPLIGNRNFKIVARFRHSAADQGVLFAIGDVAGGLVLYIEDGTLRLTYNGYGRFHGGRPQGPAGERSAVLESRRSVGAAAAAGWRSTPATAATGSSSARH